MKHRGSALAVVLLAAAMAAPIQAHHSFAAFDMTKTLTMVGTLKEFQWTNPHTWLIVTAPNAAGTMLEYRFEGVPPAILIRGGWTEDTLQVGDRISIDFHPFKDGAPGGSYIAVTLPNGKRLGTSGSSFVPFTPVNTPRPGPDPESIPLNLLAVFTPAVAARSIPYNSGGGGWNMKNKATRREVLLAVASGSALLSPLAAAVDQDDSSRNEDRGPGEEKAVGSVEGLMREHGVLRRILLVYDQTADRLRAGASVDPAPLNRAARLFRSFGEDYHEKMLEEAFIFPTLRKVRGPAAAYPDILTAQHHRGRVITDYLLETTARHRIKPSRAAVLAHILRWLCLDVPQSRGARRHAGVPGLEAGPGRAPAG